MLINIQSNALKFTDRDGSVDVFYTIYRSEDKYWLEVQVKDTGMGIKRADKKKLFKLFGFVQTTQAVNTRGIGLGLVISKKIVEMYDGNIGFKSKWGVGSTFGFNIQIELGDNFASQMGNNTMSLLDSKSNGANLSNPECLDTEPADYQANPDGSDTEQDLDALVNGNPIMPNNVMSHLPQLMLNRKGGGGGTAKIEFEINIA